MSPTTSPPRRIRIAPLSVTTPISAAPVCHFSQTASTSATFAGSTTAEHPLLGLGDHDLERLHVGLAQRHPATSRSIPTPPAEAISPAEEVSPAAPRSWSETSRPFSSSSRQHSSTFDSSKGSPICTVGRFASSPSPSSAEASTEAPPIPSRPVEAPIRTTALPTPAAAARTMSSVLAQARRTSR